jgi:acyl carrier protein
MAVEEEFHLEIPNAAAAKMSTVGDMHLFLVAELKRLGRTDVDADRIFERLRHIVCTQLAVGPELVVPEASFVRDLGAD